LGFVKFFFIEVRYTRENQGWDGTYKGEPVPEGMYICNLKITKLNKDKVQEQGVVMVLNN